MTTTKKWYQSKTMWGSIITFILGLLGLVDAVFGTKILPEINPFIDLAVTVLGAFGIYARKVASTVIQ